MNNSVSLSLLKDRILGSLLAAAIGDAMGSATEQHQIDEIIAEHGRLLDHLIPPPIDTFSYRGDGVAGYFTDDTSQMIALAEELIATQGKITVKGWVNRLLDWATNSFYRDQMGPTTRPLLEAIARGESIDHIGVVGKSNRKMTSMGVTNGAAMRVAPAGLIHPGNIEAAVQTAWVTCQPTHDTHIAAAGAGAIAAGCAAALLPDADVAKVLDACLEGARLGETLGSQQGRRVAGPSVYRRIEIALQEIQLAHSLEDALRRLEASVGNSVYMVESVPAAIGIFAFTSGNALQCAIGGTNIGNDTDTIAAMAAALAGALNGSQALPAPLVEQVNQANRVDFAALATQLASVAFSNVRL